MTDAELAEAVAAAIAVVLGFPAPTVPPRCTNAATATVALARWYLYGDQVLDPVPVLPDPVTGPDLFAGLSALAVRVYHDPASPGGVVGGDAYTGAALPEDLLAHVHHYLNRYKTAWGFA